VFFIYLIQLLTDLFPGNTIFRLQQLQKIIFVRNISYICRQQKEVYLKPTNDTSYWIHTTEEKKLNMPRTLHLSHIICHREGQGSKEILLLNCLWLRKTMFYCSGLSLRNYINHISG
jgi:hypothetical protein